MAHATRMSDGDTALLVIDVQERLMPKILNRESVIRNIAFLIDGARLLDMPVLATEQYPKGLGATVSELLPRLPERPEKVAFSSCAVPAVTETLRRKARPKVVLCGIETHVCVLQTALDLLANDFRVYIAADAVSSRYAVDHDYGLRRMERSGGVLVTSEMAVFEWMGGADHPKFKAVSSMVQERMKAL